MGIDFLKLLLGKLGVLNDPLIRLILWSQSCFSEAIDGLNRYRFLWLQMNMNFTMGGLFSADRPKFLLVVLNNRLVDPFFVISIRRCFDFNFKVRILGEE